MPIGQSPKNKYLLSSVTFKNMAGRAKAIIKDNHNILINGKTSKFDEFSLEGNKKTSKRFR